ncbi:nitroreductase family protein [Methanospirillum sp. J.3.6.1-F.2.7.3]|uniref:Nitroreductase family protein n=1 Tax=Methanospirillum purgamenti TaxID=2834276 RepID=A0A8E7AZY9_9EURY|nr:MULTISPECIES: nitroreductase family protein [Methanospirillum]MDX8551499.1 nitroreductase family protein [Methanospirillum hungatei]QVV88329.1 nitroreductase family protein [Methanospirillum sp. J.3.6.1-F.2.7.3]
MDFFDTLCQRRSVRKYRPDPVPNADIARILQAANMAPSAMNHKPWEFLVVTGDPIRELGVSFGRVLDRIQKTRGEELPAEVVTFARTYGGAPVAIVVLCTTSDLPNFQRAYLESASAAMENLLLAATALGLGTCWMTGPLEDEPFLREILEIFEDRTLVAITPLGYPQEMPGPHSVVDPDLEKKIHWIS